MTTTAEPTAHAPTARELLQERIRSVSTRAPATIEAGRPLAEALERMRAARGDCLVVCRGDRVAGIITERDVLLKVLGRDVDRSRPVDDFMTAEPDTLTPDASFGQALAMMDQGGYRNIPLVEEGRLVGLVRQQDVIEYVAEAFPEEILNLPPRPHQRLEEPEGA